MSRRSNNTKKGRFLHSLPLSICRSKASLLIILFFKTERTCRRDRRLSVSLNFNLRRSTLQSSLATGCPHLKVFDFLGLCTRDFEDYFTVGRERPLSNHPLNNLRLIRTHILCLNVRNLEILQTRILVEITPILSVNLLTIILLWLICTAFSWKHKIFILENIISFSFKVCRVVLFVHKQKCRKNPHQEGQCFLFTLCFVRITEVVSELFTLGIQISMKLKTQLTLFT